MPDAADVTQLERELRDLGARLVVGEPADVRAAVRARLTSPGGAGRRAEGGWLRSLGPRRRVGLAVAAALAALAAFAATPAGQAVASAVAHFAGVVLGHGRSTAPARPERLPGETPSGLASARARVGFEITVPPRLGTPDEVLVSDGGRVVSLVYRAGAGRPAPGPGGVSARLDEFDGELDPYFAKRVFGDAEYIDLGGTDAVWIPTPHDVTYIDASGVAHTESAHLAAATLIWQRGGVTLRLEGAFSREAAVAVAQSTLGPAGQ